MLGTLLSPQPGLILLLDNVDSFVWNLAQALQGLGREVAVVRSDTIDVDTCGDYAAIVVSPGPGRPEDAGRSVEVIRRWSGRIPLFGVCLGHQAIGHAFGARVERVAPCHGKAWTIRHGASGLLAGLPAPLTAARYHSLAVVESTLPDCLAADAWTDEGVLMALHHRTHPTFGLQFHPESFRSPDGPALLARFLEVAA